MKTDNIILASNPTVCTGCLICEMICSFHHIRRFSRSHSSITVKKSLGNPEKGVQISICRDKDLSTAFCDRCNGENSPLCVQYCPENVFTLERA